MTAYHPSLIPLTQLAAARGVLLAAVLARYQHRLILTDEALAEQLGITTDQILRLKLCETPGDEHFDEDIRQVAAHIAVDETKLRHILQA